MWKRNQRNEPQKCATGKKIAEFESHWQKVWWAALKHCWVSFVNCLEDFLKITKETLEQDLKHPKKHWNKI